MSRALRRLWTLPLALALAAAILGAAALTSRGTNSAPRPVPSAAFLGEYVWQSVQDGKPVPGHTGRLSVRRAPDGSLRVVAEPDDGSWSPVVGWERPAADGTLVVTLASGKPGNRYEADLVLRFAPDGSGFEARYIQRNFGGGAAAGAARGRRIPRAGDAAAGVAPVPVLRAHAAHTHTEGGVDASDPEAPCLIRS